ncbi:hypothetical protein [Leptospira borgpetersenii]|uniref:hypothetical protein n=1 Tax=Leptospira borgpetersenii TaxID=174 RepID=UPI00138F0635|nr:hypothetical protein [Leptospira borgpetersenii]
MRKNIYCSGWGAISELVPKPWNRKNSDKSARTIKSVRKPVNDQRAMIVGTPTFRGLRTVSRQCRSHRRQFWDKFLYRPSDYELHL